MDGAPSSIDPVQARNVYVNTITLNAYDTLYSFKYLARPYEVKPNLAVDLPEISDDGLTYTIRIKRGVYFTDDPAFEGGIGRELVAEDIVYSTAPGRGVVMARADSRVGRMEGGRLRLRQRG
jgi:ABC-type transport system substrate-binding protein